LIDVMDHVPTWIVALVLTAAAEIFAIGLMLLTRKISGLERLKLNNEVAGFKFAVVGLFYGVLLAFVVIAVWDEYRNTETAVRNEAKALVDLHRVTVALPLEAGIKIRQLLFTYTDHVRTNMSGRPWRAVSQASMPRRISMSSARRSSSCSPKATSSSCSTRQRSGFSR
jgi:hypothetical protein